MLEENQADYWNVTQDRFLKEYLKDFKLDAIDDISIAIDDLNKTFYIGDHKKLLNCSNDFYQQIYKVEIMLDDSFLVTEIYKIEDTGLSHEFFGYSLVLNETCDKLVFSNPEEINPNKLGYVGKVYTLLKNNKGGWNLANIVVPELFITTEFGYSLALSGDGKKLAISSHSHVGNSTIESGFVQVYHWDVDTWKVESGILPSLPETKDNFGWSLSLNYSGSILAVSAIEIPRTLDCGRAFQPTHDGIQIPIEKFKKYYLNNGAVYIYTKFGKYWEEEFIIENDSEYWNIDSNFGIRVELSRNGGIVDIFCNHTSDDKEGAIYKYRRNLSMSDKNKSKWCLITRETN